MDKWIEMIKKFLLQKDIMLLLVFSGILIFVIAMPTQKKSSGKISQNKTETVETETNQDMYRSRLEKQLQDILNNMDQVGNVQVMITLKESEEKILAKNSPYSTTNLKEEDGTGGIRISEEKSVEETIVYGEDESGKKDPYVVKKTQPSIEGVFIVADGGDRAEVQLQITEAVQALFGIDAHKIKIAKRKS